MEAVTAVEGPPVTLPARMDGQVLFSPARTEAEGPRSAAPMPPRATHVAHDSLTSRTGKASRPGSPIWTTAVVVRGGASRVSSTVSPSLRSTMVEFWTKLVAGSRSR